MVRLHRGDHGIHRPALERMHGRGPCPVDMAKLRIAGGEVEHPPVAETEHHLAARDRRDLGRLAIDEPEAGIVAGPADAVAGAELHVLAPVNLDASRARAEPVGLPGDGLSLFSLQHHRAGLAIDPYARFQASERLMLWGTLGYGTGDLTLTVKGRGGAADTKTDTDTGFRMAAAGARGVLVAAGDTGGFELAARTDAQIVRMTSEKADGLAATTAETSRLRLVLEGSHRIELEGGQTLTPTLEVGLRHDGGDAETGAGIEIGGGVRYADPALGLAVEAKARGLVAHEDSDYSEWGASGSVRIDPGALGRGLSLTLAPAWGAASGGADRLWSLRDARAFAANDAFDPAGRLDSEAGYGLGAFGGRGLMTPYAGIALSETGGRAWRTSVRWTLGPDVAFGVEGTRSEPANDDAPEHGLAFRATLRW